MQGSATPIPVPLSKAERLTALRKESHALDRYREATFRGCGLTETEAKALWEGGDVAARLKADIGPYLDRYIVWQILDSGKAILTEAEVSEQDPLRVLVEPPRKTASGHLADWMKYLLGAAVGAAVTWLLNRCAGE